MSTEIQPANVAAFLRDIHEATTRHQQTVGDQTKDGFVSWCAEVQALDGVRSPVLDQPQHPLARFLEVSKPGPMPGPRPVEPRRPPEGPDGRVDADVLRRYNGELQRYREVLAKFEHDLARWEQHSDLYDSLFAARNPPDALELVVAVGLLAGRTDQGELRRHLVTAPAEVSLDRETGRLVVDVVDAAKQEINWAPGDVRNRLIEDEGGLRELVECESITAADAACKKLISSFGTSGSELRSPLGATSSGMFGLGSHPAVLLRRKDTSALLQLLHDMADDMAAGGYVSDPFQMIVDPSFVPTEREVQNERAVLPLPANTDQRSMIDRARIEPHMVIQGPPGTGKTHTIANLAAVLMAEGRRVLITAENERALVEVQSKLPVSMRPLLLPMLRERGTGPLAASVNELTSRAGSGKSRAEREREMDARLTELEALELEIADAEQRLASVARADLEERRFRNTTMRLAGHLQALAQDQHRFELVDRFLSADGRGSAEDAEALLELFPLVDDRHERMRHFPLPEGLMSPGDLGIWLQDHWGSLAGLGDPGDFDHAVLAPRVDELNQLARILGGLPPTSWSQITRVTSEYNDAADDCAGCAHDVDHGVTVEPANERLAALALIHAYLSLDEGRFDRPLAELVQQHGEAVKNSKLTSVFGVFSETSKSAELTRAAQSALELLDRDQSGLLAQHVTELDLQGRSRVASLILEAGELVHGARAPLGLPVHVSESAPPPHELLRQAEVLRDHLASGGKLGRVLGTPRPVREASGLLEHVRIDGSVIDTLDEAERAVEYFTHRRSLSLIDTWAQQHGLVRPHGIDHHTWLTALIELPARAEQVCEALEMARSLIAFPLGLSPDEPAELLRITLASVARELVMTLGPLAEAASGEAVALRVDGVPLRSRAEAIRAKAALKATGIRQRHHDLLPASWREQCNPQDAEQDLLVEMLRASAAAAAVPGRARTADLTQAAVRRIIDRVEVDTRRAELEEDHERVIGGMRRVLAGCVPKSPATSAVDVALATENAADYRAAMDELDRERTMAARASRLALAEAALTDAHPTLVAAFRVGDEDAASTLRSLEDLQELRDYRSTVERWKEEVGSSEVIHRELSELHRQFRRLEELIASLRCWSSAIDRISERRELRSALSALTTSMDKVPKTRTAKSYPARMRAVREATRMAAPAIPCWVMPIDRIAEVLGYPKGEDRFDVVIVDESSQAWFTAAFLYAIADQVIVVGDDLQTSPAAQIINDDNIRSVVDEHITGHRLANQVGADLSLYDVAAVMTGPDVMVDHFRCVPEIIELSNRLSYEPKGKRLLPSRVREPGALVPVKQVEVRGRRFRSGANDTEATALVAQVAKCHADPAYAGMDFGVVVVGTTPTAHLKKLRELLLQVLGPTAMEDRDLEVGTPAEFQGAERNVMFLSLLDAAEEGRRLRTWPHEHTGQNRRRVQQLNVAVSRARDQLWIFRSFAPQDLAPDDARGVILRTTETDFPSIESQLDRCDSKFERDVVLALARADADIKIRTQVEAIGYLLDIVIEDAYGHRLAVECDGDRWHSSDPQIRKDLHRQRTLEAIGWRFERFLASEWYDDPDDRARRILDRLRSGTNSDGAPQRGRRPARVSHPEADSAHTSEQAEPVPTPMVARVQDEQRTDDDSGEFDDDSDDVEPDETHRWSADEDVSADGADAYVFIGNDGEVYEAVHGTLFDDISMGGTDAGRATTGAPEQPQIPEGARRNHAGLPHESPVTDGGPGTDEDEFEGTEDVIEPRGKLTISPAPSGTIHLPSDRPTPGMSDRDVNRQLARELRKLGVQPHGAPWVGAKAKLNAGATFAEAAWAALAVPGTKGASRSETLKCENCLKHWTRAVTRGRKPTVCPDCR